MIRWHHVTISRKRGHICHMVCNYSKLQVLVKDVRTWTSGQASAGRQRPRRPRLRTSRKFPKTDVLVPVLAVLVLWRPIKILKTIVLGRPRPRPGRPCPSASRENLKFAVLGHSLPRPIPSPGSPRSRTSSRTAGTRTVPSCGPLDTMAEPDLNVIFRSWIPALFSNIL